MGVRFYCSGCRQKLNVKAFQAGRRGLCPYCGASIDIPTKSTRPSTKQIRQRPGQPPAQQAPPEAAVPAPPPGEPAEGAPAERPGSLGPDQPVSPYQAAATADPRAAATPGYGPAPQPASPTAGPAPSQPSPAPMWRSPGDQPAGSPSPMQSPAADPAEAHRSPGGNTPVTPEPFPASTATDPLAEAPDAVWYVRPSQGGQYGPATSDVMRTWIAEGRIDADCLVWREGWRDWQQSARIFPQLGAAGLASELGAIGEGTSGVPAAGGQRHPRRIRSATLNAVIIAALIFVVVVLLGVFLWVLNSGPQGGEQPSARRPASVAAPWDGPRAAFSC